MEIYDPSRALTEDWRTYLADRETETIGLMCDGTVVEMSGARALLTIMINMPLIKRYRPIPSDPDHLQLTGMFDKSVQSAILTKVDRLLEKYGYAQKDYNSDLVETIVAAHNMMYTHLGHHAKTMDLFKIIKTLKDPEVRKTILIDYGDVNDRDIRRMEEIYKKHGKMVIDYLMSDKVKDNVFRAALRTGALKKDQFTQFIVTAGPRSDNDEKIFARPVRGSFLSGMMGPVDLGFESRAGSKSTHYAKSQMQTASYFNRLVHILNSAIAHLYEGDCGTKNGITWTIVPSKARHFLGRNCFAADGSIFEITEENIDKVIGKTVLLRDPITCPHADGYCETCGGSVTKALSKVGNIGFSSNVNTGSNVSQTVLSAKHHVSTNSAEYVVPAGLRKILMSTGSEIYIRPSVRNFIGQFAFGFKPSDVANVNDLKYLDDQTLTPSTHFSEIKYVTVGRVREDGSIQKIDQSTQIKMDGIAKSFPHFSAELLDHIREHPECIVSSDKLIWVRLDGIDTDKPIMKCTVVNNSIRHFIARFKTMIESGVEAYTSANDLTRDMANLIWEGVDPHSTHISCLVKACLITSKTSMQIPIVTDPDNVMFGGMRRVIPLRTIGGLLAYEGFNLIANIPATYITVRRHGIFDEYLGTKDIIERDMHYPPGCDHLNDSLGID